VNFKELEKRKVLLQSNFAKIIPLASLVFLLLIAPAYAHHPMGGRISSNFLEGFLSGLAHPVIGIDHLAFVVAVGFLSTLVNRGRWLPVVFLLTALGGTGMHWLGVTLPSVELLIAASVVFVGSMLAMQDKPRLSLVILIAAFGVLHGYAYGEAIIGATPMPLFAYLLGFTLIQWSVAMAARKVGQAVQRHRSAHPNPLRFVGFTVLGAGVALLVTQSLG
jgi:urease accessory protein